MLAALVNACAARGQRLVLSRVRRHELMDDFSAAVDARNQLAVNFQPQLDLGLEWCERQLLDRHGIRHAGSSPIALADHELCAGASAVDVAYLEARIERRSYEPGMLIIRKGEPADSLYFLMRGEVSVVIPLPGGGSKRLSTLTAGMAFGESSLLSGGQRGADVRADAPVDCCVLRADEFNRLEQERPSLTVRLLTGLLRSVTRTSARLTAEVAALEG
jgi:glutaminase